MKKVVLALVFVFSVVFVNAQDASFGVSAGYLNTSAKVKGGGESITSDAESGFYVGGLVEIELSDKFALQPEVLFASFKEGSGLLIPIMAKYSLSEKFYLQGGPQLTFDLESEDIEDYSKTTLHLPIGLGFDITENFFAQARYALPISNAYTGDLDLKVSQNFITVGVGYRF